MDRREFLAAGCALAGCGMTDSGSGPNYTGYGSPVSDGGDVGLRLNNADRYQIVDQHYQNFGVGVDIQRSAGAWQHAGRISGVSARSCYRGFWLHNEAEYETVSDCWADDNVFGFVVESGNNNFNNCKARFNSVGVRVYGGTNNAHGTWTGLTSNHNTYNLVCEAVTLGESFFGCNFIAGQGGTDQGVIQMIGSKGIAITGGQIAYGDISVDATSQLSLSHVVLRGPVNVTVAAGGVFKSCNPVVMSGATLTLNGASWNGTS